MAHGAQARYFSTDLHISKAFATPPLTLLWIANSYTFKAWLGHANINTTHGYIEIDMKMKREALEACQPPKVKTRSKRRPKWQQPSILQWLDELSKASRNNVQ
jgi:hypothetical protein